MNRLAMNSLAHQRGLTLVEIMVALVLGLAVIAGILQITSATKETSRLQREINFIQTNIRTASEMLSRDIRMAGFHNPNALITVLPERIVATGTSDGGSNLSDQITVSYLSNTDCLGQDTPVVNGNQLAINTYSIQNQRLMCLGNGNASAQPLVDGVESMQILYGEDTDSDGSPNRYVQPTVANLANVSAIRIGLRFRGEQNVRAGTDTNQYTLLDADPVGPFNDRVLRREATLTILLRN